MSYSYLSKLSTPPNLFRPIESRVEKNSKNSLPPVSSRVVVGEASAEGRKKKIKSNRGSLSSERRRGRGPRWRRCVARSRPASSSSPRLRFRTALLWPATDGLIFRPAVLPFFDAALSFCWSSRGGFQSFPCRPLAARRPVRYGWESERGRDADANRYCFSNSVHAQYKSWVPAPTLPLSPAGSVCRPIFLFTPSFRSLTSPLHIHTPTGSVAAHSGCPCMNPGPGWAVVQMLHFWVKSCRHTQVLNAEILLMFHVAG